MSVDKVILKAFLNTLAAIALLFVFMLGALVAVYPETMMEITYDMGMDSPCIWFAERAYIRHNDIDDMVLAMEVAIGDNNYKKVVSCGEKVIQDDEFEKLCETKDEQTVASVEGIENAAALLERLGTYEQYVYGRVCSAKYSLGDKEAAVERAFELTVGFPRNNAVVAVLSDAMLASDTETLADIQGKMNEMQSGDWQESERIYFGKILTDLGELLGSQKANE